MNRNLENICRVCLSSGSRNIFEKASTVDDIAVPKIDENVSSLDRLPEKLRYVTMLKVDECENLPKRLCDSCIIQLNVAYNLKKNAIQSDIKLRQYIIEYGMNVTSYTTCSINTVSLIGAQPLIAPNTSSTSMTITTAKSTNINQMVPAPAPPKKSQAQPASPEFQPPQQPPPPPAFIRPAQQSGQAPVQSPARAPTGQRPPAQQSPQRRSTSRAKQNSTQPPSAQPPAQAVAAPALGPVRHFPVMPIIIKEEPIDYDDVSDITIETNNTVQRRPFNAAHSVTPLPVNTMVSVNARSLEMARPGASDSDFISAYMSPSHSTDTSNEGRLNASNYRVAKQKVRTPVQTIISSTASAASASPKASSTPKAADAPRAHRTPQTPQALNASGAAAAAAKSRADNDDSARQIRTRRQSIITRTPDTPTRRLRERADISYAEAKLRPLPVEKAIARSVRGVQRRSAGAKHVTFALDKNEVKSLRGRK